MPCVARVLHRHAAGELPDAAFFAAMYGTTLGRANSDSSDAMWMILPRRLGDHRGQDWSCRDEEVGRGEVGRDDLVPFIFRKVDEWMAALDAGVVHEDVDRADLPRDRRDAFVHRAGIGDVEQRRMGHKPFARQCRNRAGECVRTATVDDHLRTG